MSAHQEGLFTCACPACLGVRDGGDEAGAQGALGSDLTGGATKPVQDLAWVIQNLSRNNYKWQTTPILFDFDETTNDTTVPLTAEERAFTRAAFQALGDIVPLVFQEQATPTVGSITFVKKTTLESGVWGQASTSRIGTRITGSDIELSTTSVATRAWLFGGYNYQALTHEIMHALGIPHPGTYNAGSGQTITYENSATYFQDSRQYTIMSYFDPGSTGASWQTTGTGGGIWSPATPMLHDIAVLQAIYGANTATRSGDTVYGYDSNAGRDYFDFDLIARPVVTPSGGTVNPAPVFTIWDGGGIDTLNLSRSTVAVDLDLREGAFSSTHGMKWNIAIAYGAVIENATGGSGNDTITGNAVANLLIGGAGDDSLTGAAGDDVLTGGAGSDILDGGDGTDTASYADAGSGVYAFFGDLGNATGDARGDRFFSIENMTGSAFNDVIGMDAGANRIDGGSGDDALYGMGGDDTLIGGLGWDVLVGGDGTDTASYANAASGVYVFFGDLGNATGEARGDRFFQMENITGSAFNDVIGMDDGANLLDGGAGDDALYGLGGDDTLVGGLGGDVLVGGDGTDTASYANAASGVYVFFGDLGNATGEARGDRFFQMENITGSAFNDVIGMDDGANLLDGGAGDDALYGLGGNDTLVGGLGADTVMGGLGSDLLDGGDGRDTASYAWSSSGVYVFFGDLGNATGEASGDRFLSIENLTGSAFNDVLGMNDDANLLDGGAGDDALYGLGGNDTLIGGRGADYLVGGAGSDTFVFRSGDGADVIVDFSAGVGAGDTLDLRAFGFANFAAVRALATDTANGLSLALPGGGSILLVGVSSSVFASDDVLI